MASSTRRPASARPIACVDARMADARGHRRLGRVGQVAPDGIEGLARFGRVVQDQKQLAAPDAGARDDLARGLGRIVGIAAHDVFAAAHHVDLGERAAQRAGHHGALEGRVGHPGAHLGRVASPKRRSTSSYAPISEWRCPGAPCQALGVERLRDPERAAGGGGIGMRDQRIAERHALAVPAELGERLALAQPGFVEMLFEQGSLAACRRSMTCSASAMLACAACPVCPACSVAACAAARAAACVFKRIPSLCVQRRRAARLPGAGLRTLRDGGVGNK
jgi:hypothetical protein